MLQKFTQSVGAVSLKLNVEVLKLNVEMPARILIVEDDDAVRRVMEVALRSAGYLVSSTTTATGAFPLLEDRQPDLVVLDLVMPGMDGESFCQEARAKGYDGRVLVVSGSESACESAARLRAQFIRKPFDPENLCAAVNWSLRQTRKRAGEPFIETGR